MLRVSLNKTFPPRDHVELQVDEVRMAYQENQEQWDHRDPQVPTENQDILWVAIVIFRLANDSVF